MSVKDIESDLAADVALRRITTVNVLQQLNLFDTVVYLYSLGEINPFEYERLSNHYETELERKSYLLTQVMPSKGAYKGYQLLKKALKETGQYEILNSLEKAYEDAMNTINDEESKRLSNGQVAANDRCDSISSSIVCASDRDSVDESLDRNTSPSSQSSSDDGSDLTPHDLSVPQQQYHQQPPPSPMSPHIIIHVPLTQSATVSVTPCSHRERSNHISCISNPYRPHTKCQHEQSIEVTVNSPFQDDSANCSGDINTENVS